LITSPDQSGSQSLLTPAAPPDVATSAAVRVGAKSPKSIGDPENAIVVFFLKIDHIKLKQTLRQKILNRAIIPKGVFLLSEFSQGSSITIKGDLPFG
jgi:hypothetical protein